MIYLKELSVHAEKGAYPFNCDSVLSLNRMALNDVTIIAGDNGSGKSTLMEALARALRFPSIGSADAGQDKTLDAIEPLSCAMKLVFSLRPRNGFFLRAEDFFGFTKRVSALQAEMRAELRRVDEEYAHASAFTKGQARAAYAGSLAELNSRYGLDPDACSHGEAFLNLFSTRMNGSGLYLLDEPEAPLSPLRQLALVSMILEKRRDSQFVIATHSPILMAIPDADIWLLNETGARRTAYESLESVRLMRDFLNAPERYMTRLMRETGL